MSLLGITKGLQLCCCHCKHLISSTSGVACAYHAGCRKGRPDVLPKQSRQQSSCSCRVHAQAVTPKVSHHFCSHVWNRMRSLLIHPCKGFDLSLLCAQSLKMFKMGRSPYCHIHCLSFSASLHLSPAQLKLLQVGELQGAASLQAIQMFAHKWATCGQTFE